MRGKKPYWPPPGFVVDSGPDKHARTAILGLDPRTAGGRFVFLTSPLAGEVGDALRVAG